MANEIRINKVAAEAVADPTTEMQVAYVYNEVITEPPHAVQVASMYAEVIHDATLGSMGQPIVLTIA